MDNCSGFRDFGNCPYTINTKDDTFAGKVQKVIDFLALNLKKK